MNSIEIKAQLRDTSDTPNRDKTVPARIHIDGNEIGISITRAGREVGYVKVEFFDGSVNCIAFDESTVEDGDPVKTELWFDIEYRVKQMGDLLDEAAKQIESDEKEICGGVPIETYLKKFHTSESLIETHPDYWDCECDNDYIHYNSPDGQAVCQRCDAHEADQPDSRVNELIEKGYI
jgi:hypothetical protein